MTINLPPDPNDAARNQAPAFPPPAGAPANQPSAAQRSAPAAPAFPDGSHGAAYRQPYVVTRRNNARKWTIIGAVVFTLALVLGIVLFLAVGLPMMFGRP